MSGTYPADPCFESIRLSTRRAQSISETVTFRKQVRDRVGHQYLVTASYSPMSKTEFAPVSSFLENQVGALETFQIVLPIESEHSGDVQGNPLASGAIAAGATTAAIDGFTGTLPAGDYIKWSSHSKVYRVTVGTTGPGSITFQPPLQMPVADNEQLVFDNVPFTMRQAGPVQEYAIQKPSRYAFEVDLEEAV